MNSLFGNHRSLLTLNVCVKSLLVALLMVGAFSGLEQFEGKAFGARLIAYPAAVVMLPILWRWRRPARQYPALADMLLTLPFLIDVLGNALNLYDTVNWWDDANHFVNWALLSGGAGLLLRPAVTRRWITAGLMIGFGAATAILWELAEYVTFIRNSTELATAYTDTLGDLAFGLLGAVVAAGLASTSSD